MITNCPVCGRKTRVYQFHQGGRGPVDCVICDLGMESMDSDHPGIIERLSIDWQLREMARIEAQHRQWKAGMRWKLAIGAGLALAWLILFWRW